MYLYTKKCRGYIDNSIPDNLINILVNAATYTPSGKNLQPWRIKIIRDKEIINEISDLSIYGEWMKTAPCFFII